LAKARITLGALVAFVMALVAVVPATARPDPAGVVVEALSDPRGIAAAGGRTLLLADSSSGKVMRLDPRRGGKPVVVSTFAELPFDPEAGPSVVEVDHQSSTTSGSPCRRPRRREAAGVVRLDRKGNETVSVDIAGYQHTNPDPTDLEGLPEESNPFGLAILPGGGVLLADSANNDVLRIDQKRKITTVARFLPEEAPWPDGLPFPGPPPGTPVPAESVPTAIAIDPDGAWYVSELKGFPFAKGAPHIWRIEPGAENATCDPANPNTGACTTYATGFTEIFGDPPIGALWTVDGGTKTELAEGTLMAPGGVTVSHNGSLSVTTGTVFGPGGGGVVRVNP
jgi:hypothetical protein